MKQTFFQVSLFLALSFFFSGCYRYQLHPESAIIASELRQLKAQNHHQQACVLANATMQQSAESLLVQAECAERNNPTTSERSTMIALYKKAAECGSQEAEMHLLRLNESLPLMRYTIGQTSILLFDNRASHCGFEREVTTTGWIVSPIAVPAYVTGATAAAGIGASILIIAFTAAAIL